MPGVDTAFISHHLNVSKDAQPVVQRARRSAVAHIDVVIEEVDRLLEADAIKEVQYQTWLANTVVVKKNNRKWRVCMDYTNLNNACPKDCFPLSKIDQLVDATAGHARLSFMDAFWGYHQIAVRFGPRKNHFHYTERDLLLQGHAVQLKECRSHLLANDLGYV